MEAREKLITKIISIAGAVLGVIAIIFSIVACCLLEKKPSVAVKSFEKAESGEIVVYYTDGTEEKLPNTLLANGKDGKSAYDLYLTTVPEGETPLKVEEWLATLKGADGKDGVDGVNGVDGKDGLNGKDGTNGVGIAKTEVIGGKFVVTYTDGKTDTLDIGIPEQKVCEHEFYSYKLKGATCTEKGFELKLCTKDCNHFEVEEIEPNKENHKFKTVTVAPTCEADGYSVKVCEYCNHETEKFDIVKAKGHNYNDGFYATTADGKKILIHTCTECGKVEFIIVDDGKGEEEKPQ